MASLDFSVYNQSKEDRKERLLQIALQLTRVELVKLRTRTTTAELEAAFGKAEEPRVEWVTDVRMAIYQAIAMVDEKPALKPGSVLMSSWQGKLKVEMKDAPAGPKLFVTHANQEIDTGNGPVMNLYGVRGSTEFPLHAMTCFSKNNNEDGGIKVAPLENMTKSFPTVSIPAAQGIVSSLSADVSTEKNTNPYAVQEKIAGAIAKHSIESQRALGAKFVCEVLKVGKIDQDRSAQTGQRSYALMKKPPEYVKQYSAEQRGHKVGLYAWVSPFTPPNKISLPVSEKRSGEHGPVMVAASYCSGMIGGTSIMKMSRGAGLSPGLSEQEADTIRFVTVAMAEIEKYGPITVEASEFQLTMLFYSLLEKLKAAGKDDKTARDTIKEYVRVVRGPLGKQAFANMSSYFTTEAKATKHYVAWRPAPFTLGTTMEATIKANTNAYDDLNEHDSYSVFRQVYTFDAKKSYYQDGYPAFFNVWESTNTDLRAVVFKSGYLTEQLVRAKGSWSEYFMRMMLALITYPWNPSIKRSWRIMAVRGTQKLTVEIDDKGDAVVADGSLYAIDLDGYAPPKSLFGHSYEYQEDKPSVLLPSSASAPPAVASPAVSTESDTYSVFEDVGGAEGL